MRQRLKKISDSLKYKLKDAYNSYLTEMLEGEDDNKNKKFYKFLKNRKRDSSGVPPLTNKQGETITDTKGKAEVLNKQYQSVFTKENNQSIPPVNNQNLNMPDINFTTNGISKLLSKPNPQKANGPDKIPIRFLKDYADDIAEFLIIYYFPKLSQYR